MRTLTEIKGGTEEPCCNLEIEFKSIKLPDFSDKSDKFMTMSKFNNFNLWKQEIEEKV